MKRLAVTIKFRHTLIYSDKLNELAIVKEGWLRMVHIETGNDKSMDDLNSRIYFETGRNWVAIDEWFE